MGYIQPTPISDEELRVLCKDAIAKGGTATGLFFHLRTNHRKIGDHRLYRVWKECGGRVQYQYRGE